MAVYKEEKTGTWRVIYRYTDWTGEKKQTQKRGFQTKREAQTWEREQLNKARADLDMTFKSFVEQYTADMQQRNCSELVAGRFVVRFIDVLTTRFDTKRFKEKFGEEVYNAFTKQVPSKRFSISV